MVVQSIAARSGAHDLGAAGKSIGSCPITLCRLTVGPTHVPQPIKGVSVAAESKMSREMELRDEKLEIMGAWWSEGLIVSGVGGNTARKAFAPNTRYIIRDDHIGGWGMA